MSRTDSQHTFVAIKRFVNPSRDRTSFHQIPEIALVTGISKKQCFLAPSMPWENEIIESYQWKISIQNPDIIKITRKRFRCRLALGRNPLALLPRLEHFSPQISSISLKSLKILENPWKLLKNDHNLIDFKISLLCCHESNVFHHKFVDFWAKTSTFEQKLEISCTCFDLDSNPSVQSNLSRTEQNVNCEHMRQMDQFLFATIRENCPKSKKSNWRYLLDRLSDVTWSQGGTMRPKASAEQCGRSF